MRFSYACLWQYNTLLLTPFHVLCLTKKACVKVLHNVNKNNNNINKNTFILYA